MANPLPLDGLRVLDVSSFIAAPAAAVYFDAPLRHYNFSKGWAEWRARHLR